ncbi:hypothetical protein KSP40_PGU017899 [Platanthera guangdongensis]|uniref:Uncharacterized protein n=1 Tax=Platanthera guangdongensis TaxID=2320717 RepID=A0ABR2LKR4_9ASPA
MSLLLSWLNAVSCSSSEGKTSVASRGGASIVGATPEGRSSFSALRIESSTASEILNSNTSASDDIVSVLTHPSLPSLPSLQSLIPRLNPSHLFSASFLRLCSLAAPSSGTGSTVLAFSASSHLLYTANESFLSVYDLSDLRPIEFIPIPPGTGATKSISLSLDGPAVFTTHQDGSIRVWRRSSRSGLHRLQTSLPTPADQLRRLPLPKNYVTVRRHQKCLWIKHADAVSGISSGTIGLFYSVSWDKTLKVWSSSSLRCLESIQAHEDAVNAVAVAADGTVYTGSADCMIRVWVRSDGAETHDLVATLDRHRSSVNALALSSDGSVLYSGACDRSVLVWEREKCPSYMAVTGALRGHERAILCLACVGELVISGSGDRTVRIWRREGFRMGYSCLAVMEGHARGIKSLAAVRMPNGDEAGVPEVYRVCSGSLDGELAFSLLGADEIQAVQH